MADGLLEFLSPPTLGMSANNGDDSSFELCAIAFFFLKDMDKEVRENGVGIRSLIAALSRAARGCARHTGDTPLGQNFFAAQLAGNTQTAAGEGRSRAILYLTGTLSGTRTGTHTTHTDTHGRTDAPTTLGRRRVVNR